MGVMKKMSIGQKATSSRGGGSLIVIDSKELTDYVTHLKKLSYNEMNNGVKSIVRQVANDIKKVYLGVTPRRSSGGRTGKYGATPGNLQRSLRVFAKRQKDPFLVEFSVGFKQERNLMGKIRAGGKVTDGYYGWMLSYGVEGREKGKTSRSMKHFGFIEKARSSGNKIIAQEVSERVTDFIHKKMEKMIKAS